MSGLNNKIVPTEFKNKTNKQSQIGYLAVSKVQ